MKRIICSLLAVAFVTVASAQDNPLKRCAVGDWAKYLVTTKNETIPMMSGKDKPNWRVVAVVIEDAVRINGYFMIGQNRSSTGGAIYSSKEPYEPVAGLSRSKKVKVVSTSKEKLTIGGKQYDCTKIVRKVDQPLDETTFSASWIGTSTLWFADSVPLGLVKMENSYFTKLTKEDDGMKIAETWVLAEYGFKDWKEE
jgi:hypothetical protein